jgi:hypothetical protein
LFGALKDISKAVSILEGEFPQLTYGKDLKDAWFFIVAKAKESRPTVKGSSPAKQPQPKRVTPKCTYSAYDGRTCPYLHKDCRRCEWFR